MGGDEFILRKNFVFVIGFLIIAAVLIVLCSVGSKMLKNTPDTPDEPDVSTQVTQTEKTEVTEGTTIQEDTEVTAEPDDSERPVKLTYSMGGCEITDINAVLDKEKNKTYRMDLSDFAENEDIIDSFTFYFDAADGVSNLGNVKGGFGISVSEDCPYSTDEKWYQPEDFSVSVDGAHCEVTWEVPEEIKKYIGFDGKVLFGYWWSDVSEIRLDRVVCMKNTLKELPFDGEKTINIDKVLKYDDAGNNKLVIPMSDLITELDTLQYVSLKIETSNPENYLRSTFGLSVNGEPYQTKIISSGNSIMLNINWIVPEKIKYDIDKDKDLEFLFTGGDNSEIKVKNIYVQYSTD